MFSADDFDRKAQIAHRIRSENIDFLEMMVRNAALNPAVLILNI
jgi:hypothetical protein